MDIEIDRFKNLKDLFMSRSDLSAGERNSWTDEKLQKTSDRYFKHKVLVIGAGGLGCELVKNLALAGIRNISLVDMDTIELTNLNRQFLFRKKDVGRYKAEVAAEFVMARVPECNIKFYNDPIQKFSDDFMKEHLIWISGLDSIAVRSYLNRKLFSILEYDENWNVKPSSIRMMIDGGTEGMSGQAQTIIPYDTQCYDCIDREAEAGRTHVNMCTLANTPRIPEHCIMYIMQLEWGLAFPDKKYDSDSAEDMQWICKKAQERAEKFNIKGVNFKLTMGVVKNIVPIVASTNSIIAAVEVHECMKIFTYCAKVMDGTMRNTSGEGLYNRVEKTGKSQGCQVCGKSHSYIEISKEITLQEMINQICAKLDIVDNGKLFIKSNENNIKQITRFADETEGLLPKKIGELLNDLTLRAGKEIEVKNGHKEFYLRPIYKS